MKAFFLSETLKLIAVFVELAYNTCKLRSMVTLVGFEPNALHLERVATYTARPQRHKQETLNNCPTIRRLFEMDEKIGIEPTIDYK